MKEALALVETRGLSTAILVADVMLKTSNVHIIDIENTKGMGYMTIKISGNVGAVNAAVTAGKQIALENNAFVSSRVIPRPSDYIEGAFCQPKKEQTEPKDEEKPIENLISEEIPDSKVVEDINEEAIQTFTDISKEINESIVEEENEYEEKELLNTENNESEEKKVKKNSRRKKENKKDNDDRA